MPRPESQPTADAAANFLRKIYRAKLSEGIPNYPKDPLFQVGKEMIIICLPKKGYWERLVHGGKKSYEFIRKNHHILLTSFTFGLVIGRFLSTKDSKIEDL